MPMYAYSPPCHSPDEPTQLTFFSVPRSSYYDKDYRQSAALIRARRPYLVKNILTGTAIFAFAIGVCTLDTSSLTDVRLY